MLLGVIFPMPAAAQQSVRGTVRDTAGIALGGAEVHVGERRTKTDSLGAFRAASHEGAGAKRFRALRRVLSQD
jgi:hypothetical protein